MPASARVPRTHRIMAFVIAPCVVAAGLIAGMTTAASAHATVLLNGKDAKAGKRGVVTMRIPHGCNGTLATNKVKTRFGKKWKAKPKAVQGWSSQKRRTKQGRTVIVWRAVGQPLGAKEVQDFKLRVRYPKKAGIYSTPTIQVCGDVKSKWTAPDRGGADGHHAYPVDYPVPRIKVGA
ncbi:MAG: DUF1775 domain-containing protein [Actinomycetia bacterium]|nr:DUF1775 domain-containing protein [Actinomycetes bacterium]